MLYTTLQQVADTKGVNWKTARKMLEDRKIILIKKGSKEYYVIVADAIKYLSQYL